MAQVQVGVHQSLAAAILFFVKVSIGLLLNTDKKLIHPTNERLEIS